MQFIRRSFVRLNLPLAFKQTNSTRRMLRLFSDMPPSVEKTKENPTNEITRRQPVAEGAQMKRFSTYEDLMMLTKFRLSTMNTIMALAGYMLVPGSELLSLQTLWFTVAVQLIAMSSQTFNQILERHHDSKMLRTCMRPIPQNRVSVSQAAVLATAMWFTSNTIFYSLFPIYSSLVANSIFLSYTLLYTPMKRTSENNTIIGSLVGSLPPLLGWVSASGALLSPEPWSLVLFMFAWQFPHFYGILWTHRSDYEEQGFQMIKDHKKASLQMKAAVSAMAASVMVLTEIGTISYLGMVAMAWSLYKYSYCNIVTFERDPTVSNAEVLKNKAYILLMIMLFAIFSKPIIIKILQLNHRMTATKS